MRLRSLLSKRLRIHAHLVDPSLTSVQAAADGDGPRGFVTPNLGNILGVIGLGITLIGGYTNLRSTQQSEVVGLKAEIHAANKGIEDLQKQRDADVADNVRQFTVLRARFNAEVVGRPEIEGRFSAVQAWQMQVNGLLLQKAGH